MKNTVHKRDSLWKGLSASFSEAINNEVRSSGVTVTSLCPGATESGFQEAASLQESRLVKGRKLPTSKEVAEYGYNAMLKGRSVDIHGIANYLIANSVRYFPRSFFVKLTRFVQDKNLVFPFSQNQNYNFCSPCILFYKINYAKNPSAFGEI